MNRDEALQSLRGWLKDKSLDAFLITGTDVHSSEYVPAPYGYRALISGFTGSAGSLIVTQSWGGLWTDSRYYIQGEQELVNSTLALFRDGSKGVPTLEAWAEKNLSGKTCGIDGKTISRKAYLELAEKAPSVNWVLCEDPFEVIWVQRPNFSSNQIWDLESNFPSPKREEKLAALEKELLQSGAQALLITRLDQIAWLLNLRGSDIPYNPFFLAYMVMEANRKIHLFTQNTELPLDKKFGADPLWNIITHTYEDLAPFLEDRSGFRWLQDPATTPAGLLPPENCIWKNSSLDRKKAQKSSAESAGMEVAQEKDTLAMVDFLAWLEEASLDSDEMMLAEKLLEIRSAQKGFLMESFSPIVGAGPNGAIVHYSVSPESSRILPRRGFVLVDSGGHYQEGTTDITRTIFRGVPTEEEKLHYTLVLKGMIALTLTPFPEGTRGYQLDTLARRPLWKSGLNYGHGTGHGVGHVLGVHEGPGRISPAAVDQSIQSGMIFSNEPGFYLPGKYGIRIENLIQAQPDPMRSGFLCWKTLTHVPMDPIPVNPSLLDAEEKRWLLQYHQNIELKFIDKLSPSAARYLRDTTDLWRRLLR